MVRKSPILVTPQNLGGSEQLIEIEENIDNQIQMGNDHSYTRSDNVTEDVTVSDSDLSQNTLEVYLDVNPDISLSDLQHLSSENYNSLRSTIGLLWHYRLGHMSKTGLQSAAKVIPKLKFVKFTDRILDCEVCKKAKLHRLPSPSQREHSSAPFALIHSDLMGPITPPTFRNEEKYIMTVIDDYTRFAFAYPFPFKQNTHYAFGQFINDARLIKHDVQVTAFRTDRGTEYQTAEFKQKLSEHKVIWVPVPSHTPELNGTAERFNRTIQDKIRALLFDSGFPATLWAYALGYAVYLYNQTPKQALKGQTPIYLMTGNTNPLQFVKRFGCLSYMVNPQAKDKFASRGLRLFFIGLTYDGAKLIEPTTGKIYISKHYQCVESKVYGDFYGPMANVPYADRWLNIENTSGEHEVSFHSPIYESSTEPIAGTSNAGESSMYIDYQRSYSFRETLHDWQFSDIDRTFNPTYPQNFNNLIPDSSAYLIQLTRFEFMKSLNTHFVGENGYSYEECREIACNAINENSALPRNFKQAMQSKDSYEWKQAIKDELQSLTEHRTWKIVPRSTVPRNTRILNSRWVFVKKLEPNEVIRFKARLVIQGFADPNVYSKDEIYSPVSSIDDVRFLLSFANKNNLDLFQLDVKTAFLNSKIENLVYMNLPPGLTVSENDSKQNVCLLKKALYGLKISRKQWFDKFTDTVASIGFKPYIFKPCLFHWLSYQKYVFLLLYVDDILMTGNCNEKIQETIRELGKRFNITYLGEPSKFIGIHIVRDKRNNKMFLHQKPFIKQFLAKYNPKKEKPLQTPMRTNEANNRRTQKQPVMNNIIFKSQSKFQEIIGSLLYLANTTRPDLTL